MNILLKSAMVMTSCAALAGCCGSQLNPALDKGANELVKKLADAASSGKFYYAHQDALVYGHTWKVEDAANDSLLRSDVNTVSGNHPGMVGFDLGGIELGSAANLDGVDFNLMRRAAVKHSESGGIVTFSWHARNPITGGDSWDINSDKAVESVLEGGINHENFILWLSRAADFIASLKDSEGNTVPVIFRPWHENIGSWFWWGGNLCTPEQYKALYAMTRDYMAGERGLKNIVWAYSPNSEIDSTQYFSRYPGDDYVEILGVDHYAYIDRSESEKTEDEYMAAANTHYMERLEQDLKYMQAYATEHGKLVAVSETGFESIPYTRWWTEVLLHTVEKYPVAYVLTWRNAWDKPEHYYAPYDGSADADNFREFSNNPKVLMLGK